MLKHGGNCLPSKATPLREISPLSASIQREASIEPDIAAASPKVSPLLTREEIKAVSGGYEQPRRQLAELHAQGFWRARLSRSHDVILERAHYEAVCAGALVPRGDTCHTARPKLRSSTQPQA